MSAAVSGNGVIEDLLDQYSAEPSEINLYQVIDSILVRMNQEAFFYADRTKRTLYTGKKAVPGPGDEAEVLPLSEIIEDAFRKPGLGALTLNPGVHDFRLTEDLIIMIMASRLTDSEKNHLFLRRGVPEETGCGGVAGWDASVFAGMTDRNEIAARCSRGFGRILEAAKKRGIHSLAMISVPKLGELFPAGYAAEILIATARTWIARNRDFGMSVEFCCEEAEYGEFRKRLFDSESASETEAPAEVRPMPEERTAAEAPVEAEARIEDRAPAAPEMQAGPEAQTAPEMPAGPEEQTAPEMKAGPEEQIAPEMSAEAEEPAGSERMAGPETRMETETAAEAEAQTEADTPGWPEAQPETEREAEPAWTEAPPMAGAQPEAAETEAETEESETEESAAAASGEEAAAEADTDKEEPAEDESAAEEPAGAGAEKEELEAYEPAAEESAAEDSAEPESEAGMGEPEGESEEEPDEEFGEQAVNESGEDDGEYEVEIPPSVIAYHPGDPEFGGFTSDAIYGFRIFDGFYDSVDEYTAKTRERIFRGRQPSETLWSGMRQQVRYRGTLEKFRQNPELAELLLSTELAVLVREPGPEEAGRTSPGMRRRMDEEALLLMRARRELRAWYLSGEEPGFREYSMDEPRMFWEMKLSEIVRIPGCREIVMPFAALMAYYQPGRIRDAEEFIERSPTLRVMDAAMSRRKGGALPEWREMLQRLSDAELYGTV